MSTSIQVQELVPLAPLTTLGVGGAARYFVYATTDDDVVSAFRLAGERGMPVFVLGGGSNVVVSDSGFEGLVVRIGLTGTAAGATPGEIKAAAGVDWDTFVGQCVESGLAGIECLSGIPGTVGGTPVQNVGAYGQEVSETISSVRCYDRQSRGLVELSNSECGFSYRTSIFNSNERDRYVVLSVTYRLRPGGAPKMAYRDLIDHFAGRQPTLTEAREAVLAIRRSKSMVISVDDPNSKSVGSFFKNPIVETAKYDALAAEWTDGVPHFPADDGRVKLPAAWLIERSGFCRGYVHGKAGISANHTLAIINRGGATAREVIELMEMIRTAVMQRFEITLVPEPVFVGRF